MNKYDGTIVATGSELFVPPIPGLKEFYWAEILDDYDKWITYIEDRPYNDQRYYISNEKLKQLGWNITINFLDGLKDLIH